MKYIAAFFAGPSNFARTVAEGSKTSFKTRLMVWQAQGTLRREYGGLSSGRRMEASARTKLASRFDALSTTPPNGSISLKERSPMSNGRRMKMRTVEGEEDHSVRISWVQLAKFTDEWEPERGRQARAQLSYLNVSLLIK